MRLVVMEQLEVRQVVRIIAIKIIIRNQLLKQSLVILENFITIEVGKQLLKKAGVVGSGPVIGAALVLKDAIRYEDYSISLDRKFGAYDVLTGDRVSQGGLTDTLKFFDKVAGSDKGWQETVNADGIITRVSPDGSVTATLKMPTETQANPIVEFRGSGTEVKYLPYCSDQTVKFI